MKYECTGVILAGGNNKRFPGEKKALRKVGDESILKIIYDVFAALFTEVILVVNDPKKFCGWDMNIVTDIYPSKCALAGLHAGLFYASHPYAFVTACDTPFINPDVIKYLVSQVEPGYNVIIPKTDDGLEPLSAVYSKSCIPLIEKNLSKNIFMIKKFFNMRRVKQVQPGQLKKLDPGMDFIFNINTPEDFKTAQQMSEQREEKK